MIASREACASGQSSGTGNGATRNGIRARSARSWAANLLQVGDVTLLIDPLVDDPLTAVLGGRLPVSLKSCFIWESTEHRPYLGGRYSSAPLVPSPRPDRSTIMIKDSLIYPTLPASDLARASAFYEEKLDLDPVEDADITDGVMYRLGGQFLFLYETQAKRGENTALSFVVEDIDTELDELRSRGVVFEDYDMPGLKTDNGVAEIDGMRGGLVQGQ